jgi:hypothetical protein
VQVSLGEDDKVESHLCFSVMFSINDGRIEKAVVRARVHFIDKFIETRLSIIFPILLIPFYL